MWHIGEAVFELLPYERPFDTWRIFCEGLLQQSADMLLHLKKPPIQSVSHTLNCEMRATLALSLLALS